MDLALRQGLLQFGHTRRSDLCLIENECLQVGKSLEVHQPRVGDLSQAEGELRELRLGYFQPDFGH